MSLNFLQRCTERDLVKKQKRGLGYIKKVNYMENKISEVQIVPVKPTNGLVGFASFVLDDKFYMSSIGIMTRPYGGYRLLYPTKLVGSRQMNIYYPIDKEIATLIETEVIKQFEEVMNRHDRHHSFNT